MNDSFPFSNGMVPEEEEEEELSAFGLAVACIILSVCFVVGTPGNLLVVWTIVKHVKPRSHTVQLILHLALADLLVLVTLPMWIYSLARSWVFGEVACKAMAYVIHTCMYASVFLITVMSVERFLAVRYPLKMLSWKTSDAMPRILVLAWALALLLGVPAFLTQNTGENEDGTMDCFSVEFSSETLEISRAFLETLVGFVIPFFTLAVCYCQVGSQLRQMQNRMKHKSAFLITGVVVAFAVCWLPYHVLNIMLVAQLLSGHSNAQEETSKVAWHISGALAFISSTVNPMLYAFAARNFQGGFKKSGMVKLFQDVTTHTAQSRVCEPQSPEGSDSGTQKEKSAEDVEV